MLTGPKAHSRPRPILAIGFTGHRSLPAPAQLDVSARLEQCFRELTRAFTVQCQADASLYDGSTPSLRAVSMFAEGADLIAMARASDQGMELVAVLPSSTVAFRETFTDRAQLGLYDQLIAVSAATVELRGVRGEPRYYERANELILARSDLLIAVWDGERSRGRGGTADVVRRAVSLSIPVIVVDPLSEGRVVILDDRSPLLINPDAADLARRSVNETTWAALVRRAVGVESRRAKQDILDFQAPLPRAPRRFGYQLLLAFAGRRHLKARRTIGDPWIEAGHAAGALNSAYADLSPLQQAQHQASLLAQRYGERSRSAAILRYFMAASVALGSGIIGIAFPSLIVATVAIQALANLGLLVDHLRAKRGSWNDRWLAQRIISERIRCLRFLAPLGIGSSVARTKGGPSGAADWLAKRLSRQVEGSADFQEKAVQRLAEHLSRIEIAAQVDYHRVGRRQLCRLQRRLTALAALCTVALVIAAATHLALPNGGYAAYLSLVLAVAPAFVGAFNGLKAESDLPRLIDRSGQTLAQLRRIARAWQTSTASTDTILAVAALIAQALIQDTTAWAAATEHKLESGPWARR